MKTLLLISVIVMLWTVAICMIKGFFFDDFLDNKSLKQQVKSLGYELAILTEKYNAEKDENKRLEERLRKQ